MEKTIRFPRINLADYKYELPQDRIAQQPIQERANSKLLVYSEGNIIHQAFDKLDTYIPEGSTIFFNNTRVIPARIHFKKATGAIIEVFLISPLHPSDVNLAMASSSSCTWRCMIGNLKKWKGEEKLISKITVDGSLLTVSAKLTDRKNKEVTFFWDAGHSFSEILQVLGKIPLPPYIRRDPTSLDTERYQTIFASQEGAVAAPTAGLHFSPSMLRNLKKKNVNLDYLTLHVSSGTFQPIKHNDLSLHPMHAERVIVTRKNIETLLNSTFTIAVGTTSLRTLESLYWYGVLLHEDPNAKFYIEKTLPYSTNKLLDPKKAIQVVHKKMMEKDLDQIVGITELFIVPGYTFRMIDGLATNFHMPSSTLILLVAAFVGKHWRLVYSEALVNNYRFLSYGDTSLLLPQI